MTPKPILLQQKCLYIKEIPPLSERWLERMKQQWFTIALAPNVILASYCTSFSISLHSTHNRLYLVPCRHHVSYSYSIIDTCCSSYSRYPLWVDSTFSSFIFHIFLRKTSTNFPHQSNTPGIHYHDRSWFPIQSSNKKNQGSTEIQLILRLGQEIYKMSMNHLVVFKSKKRFKKEWRYVKET